MTRTASKLFQRITKRLLPFSAAMLVTLSLQAEDVFVTVYKSSTSGDVTPGPPSAYTGTFSASGSATFSTATPQPPISPRRSRFATSSAGPPSWSITPDNYGGLYGTAALQSPGAYKVYITMPTLSNASTNLVVNMTATGGVLGDTNGVAQTSIPLSCFSTNSVANQWIFVGYLTNSQPNPTVTFSYVSGQIDGTTQNRWYVDAARFENVGDPCYGSGATQLGVSGPLIANSNSVVVTGVTAGATNVTVFANAIQIGATNYAPGFAAGTLIVPTSTPLVQNDPITAIQKKSGCVSQVGAPVYVGGGANNQLRAIATCWKNSTNAGPIGAKASAPTSGFFYFLGASSYSFGSAPAGGRTLPPGACWQTVTFQNRVDDGLDSNFASHVTNTDTFCSLEGLVFAIDGADSGPYDIYVDRIMNGDTIVEDFESYGAGTTNLFSAPNAAAMPTAAGVYLGAPNSSLISGAYAFDGSKSCRVQWQWKDNNSVRWAHIVANATSAKTYPQIDTSKPITVRVLVLPVGTTTSFAFMGTVSDITNRVPPVYEGSTNVLGVTVTGPGPYTYQWSWSGGGLPNATTDRTYVIDGGGTGLTAADNGTYTVTVSDPNCSETRSVVFTMADPVPTITNQPAHAILSPGSTVAAMSVGADGHVPIGYPLSYQWRSNGVDMIDQISSTLWVTNASVADVMTYDVVVANFYGSVTSAPASIDVVSVAAGTGTGLRGDYRTSHGSTNAFGGVPTLSRTDATVDFNFGSGSPDPSISADVFTARWTGQVQALGTDTYTFSTISDDGVRLWVNGQKLVDNWTLHGSVTNSGTISLTGTTKYDLTMEYYENAVSAVAKLYWAKADGSVGFEPIPRSQLYPAAPGVVIPTLTFGQPDTTHLVFNWGVGSYNIAWATNVLGPYSNIIYGVTSPYTNLIDATQPQKYFRLQVQ